MQSSDLAGPVDFAPQHPYDRMSGVERVVAATLAAGSFRAGQLPTMAVNQAGTVTLWYKGKRVRLPAKLDQCAVDSDSVTFTYTISAHDLENAEECRP